MLQRPTPSVKLADGVSKYFDPIINQMKVIPNYSDEQVNVRW